MTHAQKILACLDEKLTSKVDLTLYGRAALHLGFPDSSDEQALSRDVDAVLWLGQAEELNETTNFWDAIEQVNNELADRELYISHFFTEEQVILRPEWREHRVAIEGAWAHLSLYRLADLDLLLSKLMRDDPLDRADALFIVRSSGLTIPMIKEAMALARIPDVSEIREQFAAAGTKLLVSVEQLAHGESQ